MKMPGKDGLWLLEAIREQAPRHLGDHAHRLRRHRGRGRLPAPRRGGLPAQAAQADRPDPRHRARAGQAAHRAGAQALPEEARAQGARPHRRAAHGAAATSPSPTRTPCWRWSPRSTPASTRPSDHSQRVVEYTLAIATADGDQGRRAGRDRPRRAAARHRQDRRARRGAAQARQADPRRVGRDAQAPGHRLQHDRADPVPLDARADRALAPGALRRPGLPAQAGAARRSTSGRASSRWPTPSTR